MTFTFREEKLNSLRYSFGTYVLAASARPKELLAQARFQENSGFEENRNYHIGVGQGPGPDTFGLAAIITPEATDEERKAAFTFDLSCMSSFRGCQSPCEIMPAVWKEAIRRSLRNEILLPQEALADPRCSSH
jgi:hypothetical protein